VQHISPLDPYCLRIVMAHDTTDARVLPIHMYPTWERDHILGCGECPCNPVYVIGCIEGCKPGTDSCWYCDGRGYVIAEDKSDAHLVIHHMLRIYLTAYMHEH